MCRKIIALAGFLFFLSINVFAENGYTLEQLRQMALDYYQDTSPSHYRPSICDATMTGDGSVSIHLYDIVESGTKYEHTSTSAWYSIDPVTGKGTDLLNQAVDLSSYAVGFNTLNGKDLASMNPGTSTKTPFYGIWCQATKDYTEARGYAYQFNTLGYNAQVLKTTDWSNLNSEPWYVVTTGVYFIEGDAWAALPGVQAIYPDAYVKYTGEYKGNVPSQSGNAAYSSGFQTQYIPFYGIWCSASKHFSDVQTMANDLSVQGFNAEVFLTTDWSNLNSEPWYVLTAGRYSSEDAAKTALAHVQSFYPDAYVKYSGTYQGML